MEDNSNVPLKMQPAAQVVQQIFPPPNPPAYAVQPNKAHIFTVFNTPTPAEIKALADFRRGFADKTPVTFTDMLDNVFKLPGITEEDTRAILDEIKTKVESDFPGPCPDLEEKKIVAAFHDFRLYRVIFDAYWSRTIRSLSSVKSLIVSTMKAMRKCPRVNKHIFFVPLVGQRFANEDIQCQAGKQLVCRSPLWAYTNNARAESLFFEKNPDGTVTTKQGTIFAVGGEGEEDVYGFSDDGSSDIVMMQPDIVVTVTGVERGEDGIDYIYLQQDKTIPPLFEDVFPTQTKTEQLRKAVRDMKNKKVHSREEEESIYQRFLGILNGEKEGAYPEAEFYVGLCLIRGFGVPPDQKKGIYKIEVAANEGFPDAVKMVASLTRDKKKAVEWLKLCTDDEAVKMRLSLELFIPTASEIFTEWQSIYHRNDLDGLVGMGICYFYGKGTEKDGSKAYNCFKDSAKQGENLHGMNNMAVCEMQGIGCQANPERALKHFEKASKKGDWIAKVNWAHVFLSNNTESQGGKSKRESPFRLLSEACVHDCAEAHYLMSLCYQQGIGGVKRDSATAKTELNIARMLGFKLKGDLNTVGWFLSIPGRRFEDKHEEK